VVVITLPGPPAEMRAMWRDTVEPYLRTRTTGGIFSRTLRFCGIGRVNWRTSCGT